MDKYQVLINAKIKEILTDVGIDDDYSDMFVPQDLTEYEIKKSLIDSQPVDYEFISYFQNNYPSDPVDGLCDLWGPNVSPISNFVFHVIKTNNSNTINSVDAVINPAIANFMATRDFADNLAISNTFTLFKLSNAGSFMKTGDIEKDIVVDFYNNSTTNPLNVSFTIKGNRGGLILPDGTLYAPITGDLITLDVLEAAFNRYDQNVPLPDMSQYPTFADINGSYATIAQVQAMVDQVIAGRSA